MSKKRLSDAVGEVVERALTGESIDARVAATEIWDDIDADGQYMAGIEGVTARIRRKASSLRTSAAARLQEQKTQMAFDLPAAVPLDIDGHKLRPTRDLTQDEVRRAIEIRKANRDAIDVEIREWEAAERACAPHWMKNPRWTFGQCLDAIIGVFSK